MSENNDIKKITKVESNEESNLIFDETELTIINDENTEVEKNVKLSPFEGLTFEEITFSTMDSDKTTEEKIVESVNTIRALGENKENSESQQKRQEFIAQMEKAIDEMLERIAAEIDDTQDTEK